MLIFYLRHAMPYYIISLLPLSLLSLPRWYFDAPLLRY